MAEKVDQPIISFESRAELAQWLEENHAASDGIWLKFAKKDSGVPSVTYVEAVEVSLCYGWIDGQAKSLDGSFYLQKFTPRRARSKWSQINCQRAEKLIAQGQMKPPGLREVERAKADGRWEAAYASPANITVPDDLLQALAGNAAAREFFETLDGRNRYAILYQLADAKKPETRLRRIEKFIGMLAKGEKIYS